MGRCVKIRIARRGAIKSTELNMTRASPNTDAQDLVMAHRVPILPAGGLARPGRGRRPGGCARVRRAWTSRSLACVCSLRGGVGRPLCIWIDSIAGRGLLFQRIRSILAGSPSLSPRNRSQHTPTVRWTTLNCSTPVVGRVWSVGRRRVGERPQRPGGPLVCLLRVHWSGRHDV